MQSKNQKYGKQDLNGLIAGAVWCVQHPLKCTILFVVLFCGNSGYFDICRRHAEFDCRLSSIIYFIIVVRKNSMCVHYCWFMPARRTTTKKIHSMYFHSFHFKHMHIPYAYGKGMRILEFYVFTWFFLQILLGNLFTEHLLSLLKIWVNSSCTHHSLLERNDQRVNRIRTEQIVAGIN